MTILQAIILGVVQGLTEFLPISSTGHLVLVPFLLNWSIDPDLTFVFDVLVQVGTLVGVIAFFWRDLLEIIVHFVKGILQRQPFATEPARLGWNLILATLPAAVIGLLIKDMVEKVFANPAITAGALLITAAMLAGADAFNGRKEKTSPVETKVVSWREAIFIGFGQALAIFPGISRSGATITAGLLSDLDRSTAARFSFLMSIPVMIGAGALAGLDVLGTSGMTAFMPPIIAGFITSMVVGYLSIAWLLRYLARHSLTVFSIYCTAAGLLSLAVYFLR